MKFNKCPLLRGCLLQIGSKKVSTQGGFTVRQKWDLSVLNSKGYGKFLEFDAILAKKNFLDKVVQTRSDFQW